MMEAQFCGKHGVWCGGVDDEIFIAEDECVCAVFRCRLEFADDAL
jgi:hypothetical protein